jgi:hypothetical protein
MNGVRKKFLIVCPPYSSAISPRAFRWAAIAEHWAAQGHRVDVICKWNSGERSDGVLDSVHVLRVGSRALTQLRRSLTAPGGLTQADKTLETARPRGANPVKGPLLKLARGVYDFTWKTLYWPDSSGPWYLPAMKKGKELFSREAYDALISVSLPFTSHVVGYSLHKLMPRVPWLVDVGDLFVLPSVST